MLTGSNVVALDSGRVKTNRISFFCYSDSAGAQLRFILARGTDGRVRSVMDACAQCYAFHKGFSTDGKELVCRLCGNRYPIDHMLSGKASCVPVAVPSSEDGGRIRINIADLKKRKWLF